jgi:hypothetical protein
MYRPFKYLVGAPDRDPKEVLSSSIPLTQDKFITFKEGEGYRAYDSWRSFYDDLDAMDSGREFHEVIRDVPQRLKFDIDCEESLAPDEYGAIFREIVDAILNALYIVYEINARLCICVTEGSTKYSNHIIVQDYYVSGSAQAREFTRLALGYMPVDCAKWVDAGVNKPNQNFRLVKCHKKGQPERVKRIVGTRHSVADTIITNISGCTPLKDIVAREVYTEHVSTTAFCAEVRAIAHERGLDVAHRFHKAFGVGNYTYTFARIAPSVCNLCRYEHVKDNTLVIRAVPEGRDLCIYEDCRKQVEARQQKTLLKDGHAPRDRILIGRIRDVVNASPTRTSDWQIHAALRDKGPLYEEPVPNCPQQVYCEPTLREFDLVKTLFVKSAMKMGKTKKLREYMAQHFTDTPEREHVIRFISFRQTFSGNIKESFPDFALYSDSKGGLSQARLIVQVESLHRLDIVAGSEPPDLLVLDECESIFEQFESKNIKYFHSCFDKFRYLLQYSRHVICMDAHLGQRTFNSVFSIRGAREEAQLHHNTYKNATADKYLLTGDKTKWLGILYESLARDERVVIPISSLTDAKVVAAKISEMFPAKKIKLYSRETQVSEKTEHFAHVAKYWAQYDVLIYTPTITAGISFEVKHYNKIFGYFTSLSCPVETCIQMIGRIRDVADKTLVIYFSAPPASLPTTREDIEQRLYATRRGLLATEDNNEAVTCEYSERGDVVLHKTPYYPIWLENTIVRNLSTNEFIRRFIYCIRLAGGGIEHLSDEIFAARAGFTVQDPAFEKIATEIKETGATVKEMEADAICAAPELDPAALDEITNAMITGADVSAQQLASFEKHKLRKAFKFEGEITKKFVLTYNKAHIRRHYKNLCAIAGPDVEAALRTLKQAELERHLYTMSHEDTQHHDLRYVYMYAKHATCVTVLRHLGFDGPLSEEVVHTSDIERGTSSEDWPGVLRAAQYEHHVAPHTPCDITGHIRAVNTLLDEMYGVKIVGVKQHNSYRLMRAPLFTSDPAVIGKPLLRSRD